jgi:ankyrin repeat protein
MVHTSLPTQVINTPIRRAKSPSSGGQKVGSVLDIIKRTFKSETRPKNALTFDSIKNTLMDMSSSDSDDDVGGGRSRRLLSEIRVTHLKGEGGESPTIRWDLVPPSLLQGSLFWKIPYNSKAIPRKRHVKVVKVVGSNTGMLVWSNPSTPNEGPREVHLSQVTSINFGHCTRSFEDQIKKRGMAILPSERLCFSLSFGSSRTIDFGAITEVIFEDWMKGLQALCPHISSQFEKTAAAPSSTIQPTPTAATEDDKAENTDEERVSSHSSPSPTRKIRNSRIPLAQQIALEQSERRSMWLTVLFELCRKNDLASVERLFDERCPVDLMETSSGDTPLLVACRNGFVDLAKLCLLRGAKNDPHPHFGQTALQAAISSGHVKCARVILEAAQESNAVDQIINLEGLNSEAPLHESARMGNHLCVELLLSFGADYTVVDAQGRTPLHSASAAGQETCAALLIDNGSDMLLNFGDHAGDTPLHLAVFHGQTACVKLLLQTAANPKVFNIAGHTPLQLAEMTDNIECKYMLMEHEHSLKNTTDYQSVRCLLPGEAALLKKSLDKGERETNSSDFTDKKHHINPHKVSYDRHSSMKSLQLAVSPAPGESVVEGNSVPEDAAAQSSYTHSSDAAVSNDTYNEYSNSEYTEEYVAPIADNAATWASTGHSEGVVTDPYASEAYNTEAYNTEAYNTEAYNTETYASEAESYYSNQHHHWHHHGEAAAGQELPPAEGHYETHHAYHDATGMNGTDQAYQHSPAAPTLSNATAAPKLLIPTPFGLIASDLSSLNGMILNGMMGAGMNTMTMHGGAYSAPHSGYCSPYESRSPSPRARSRQRDYYDDYNGYESPSRGRRGYRGSRGASPEKYGSPYYRHRGSTGPHDYYYDSHHEDSDYYDEYSNHSSGKYRHDDRYRYDGLDRGSDGRHQHYGSNKGPLYERYGPYDDGYSEGYGDSNYGSPYAQEGEVYDPYNSVHGDAYSTSAASNWDTGHQPSEYLYDHHSEVYAENTEEDEYDVWEMYYTEDGHPYYVNRRTEVSQWEDPRGEQQKTYDAASVEGDGIAVSNGGETWATAVGDHSGVVHSAERGVESHHGSVGAPLADSLSIHTEGTVVMSITAVSTATREETPIAAELVTTSAIATTSLVPTSEIGGTVTESKLLEPLTATALFSSSIEVEDLAAKRGVSLQLTATTPTNRIPPPPSSTTSSNATKFFKIARSPTASGVSPTHANGLPSPYQWKTPRKTTASPTFTFVESKEPIDSLKSPHNAGVITFTKQGQSKPPLASPPSSAPEETNPQLLHKRSYSSLTQVDSVVGENEVDAEKLETTSEHPEVESSDDTVSGTDLDTADETEWNPPTIDELKAKREEIIKRPELQKYVTMKKMGVHPMALAAKMAQDGIDKETVAIFSENYDEIRKKPESKKKPVRRPSVPLRKLHWTPLDRERIQNSVWASKPSNAADALNIDTSQLEKVFGIQSTKVKQPVEKESTKAQLITGKRAHNVAISLTQFKTFKTFKDLSKAILSLDEETLPLKKLHILAPLLPIEAEVKILENFNGDITAYGPVECFFHEMIKLGRCSAKVQASVFYQSFDEIKAKVVESIELIERACNVILGSEQLMTCMEAVRRIGNIMNAGTNAGEVEGFKLETLRSLSFTKGADNKTTLTEYLVQVLDAKMEQYNILHFMKEHPLFDLASRSTINDITREIDVCSREVSSIHAEVDLCLLDKSNSNNGEYPAEMDHFIRTLQSFASSGINDCADLRSRLDRLSQLTDRVAVYFGEPAGTAFGSIFKILSDFMKSFLAALEKRKRMIEWERGKKRRSSRSNAGGNSNSNTEGSNNQNSPSARSVPMKHYKSEGTVQREKMMAEILKRERERTLASSDAAKDDQKPINKSGAA